jgi:hypothetical protein
MRANPVNHSSHIAPRDDGVDQPVAAIVAEVRVTESESAQVIYIVR